MLGLNDVVDGADDLVGPRELELNDPNDTFSGNRLVRATAPATSLFLPPRVCGERQAPAQDQYEQSLDAQR
jgi:hypothetical protein